jgi:putative oxidoreductase
MKRILSPSPLWLDAGLAFIRIVVGFFMILHGIEVFDKALMDNYASWDQFKSFSSPQLMVYTGKTAELIGGILLTIGLLTRVACLILIFTMLYISLFVGKGIIWYGDQHPFLFVLLGLQFFFTGPGKLSVDYMLFRKR